MDALLPSPGVPRVSVIVPVRNDPGHLCDCLLSLGRSVFRNFEVLVVDDGSRDATPELAGGFGASVVRLATAGGPAAARNAGAAAARGDLLVFLDADVCVPPDALSRIVMTFRDEPQVDAVFGSYDRDPAQRNFLSQYKNLFHHFVHQQGREEASTFWSGCGAVRRDVFLQLGGFDEDYRRPCIEDIEFGTRLVRAGGKVKLLKELQVRHLKRWTFAGLLTSDVRDRAIPWTELILRTGDVPNDLNLKTSQRGSAALALGIAAAGFAGAIFSAVWWGVTAVLLALLVLVNRDFYRFFARERGTWFAVRVVPMHVLYFLYGGLGFACGAVRHWLSAPVEARPANSGNALDPNAAEPDFCLSASWIAEETQRMAA